MEHLVGDRPAIDLVRGGVEHGSRNAGWRRRGKPCRGAGDVRADSVVPCLVIV